MTRSLRILITRNLIKAASIVLLWLLSVTTGVAAPWARPSHARARLIHTPARTAVVRSLAHRASTVGVPRVRLRKIGTSLLTRRAHFERTIRRVHADDDDAIQNDAPAADFDVDHFPDLRRLAIFVEVLEQQPFARDDRPQPPRGPPAAA